MPELDPMAEVLDQMPEPSEFADTIDPPITDDQPAPAGSDFTFDTSPSNEPIGQPVQDQSDEIFNPAIHCVDANGNPKKTKSGKFRRKRGKAGVYASVTAPQSIDNVKMQNAAAAAQVSVAATFLAGQICFGPEGRPEPGEPEQMQAAYQQFYYLSETPVNVPPWVLVFMVSSSYIAKRMALPEPRNRVMLGIQWVQEKFSLLIRWAKGM